MCIRDSLETIRGLYTGGMIRSGSYRIMGPANHSLAYGPVSYTHLDVYKRQSLYTEVLPECMSGGVAAYMERIISVSYTHLLHRLP